MLGKGEYNVFQAVLIVRYTSDEKLYLYDIQNVKKETRYPSWTTRSDGQKPASSENNYNMSQVELQDKINENNKETSSLDECECDRSEKKILKELQEAEDAVRDGKGWLSLDELKAATND